MLNRCHGCLERLIAFDFRFLFNGQREFSCHMISVYMANMRATQNKMKIESSCTQRVRAMLGCTKTARLARL